MPVRGRGQLCESVTQEWKNSGQTTSITVSSNKQPRVACSLHFVLLGSQFGFGECVGLKREKTLPVKSITIQDGASKSLV